MKALFFDPKATALGKHMLKKIRVLAAMAERRSFTIQELANTSGVSDITVRTVIVRCPKDWFEVEKLVSGAKEGRLLRYSLTENGSKAIHDELENQHLATDTDLRSPLSCSAWLRAAKNIFKKITHAYHDDLETIESLKKQARAFLASAKREINNGQDAERRKEVEDDILVL